jgi:hypothetical protein
LSFFFLPHPNHLLHIRCTQFCIVIIIFTINISIFSFFVKYVATLALGSRPRQKACKGAGQEEGGPGVKAKALQRCGPKRKLGNHITYFRECKKVWGSVREWTLTLPRQLPLWEMESRWTSKTSKSNYRGQNSMACGVLYIIKKFLKRRFLKWARIVHSDIWNTSYGQKKGRESNCQFDSRPQKVKNRPDLLNYRGRATYCWKALDKSYNFALNCIVIRGLLAKLWGSKVVRVPFGAISGLPLGSPGKKSHLDVGSVESCRIYYKGGRWWLPPNLDRGESCVFVLPVACPSTKGAPTMH